MFYNFCKWGKGYRVKTIVEEIVLKLNLMGEEEKKRTVLTISRKRADIVDHLNWKVHCVVINRPGVAGAVL